MADALIMRKGGAGGGTNIINGVEIMIKGDTIIEKNNLIEINDSVNSVDRRIGSLTAKFKPESCYEISNNRFICVGTCNNGIYAILYSVINDAITYLNTTDNIGSGSVSKVGTVKIAENKLLISYCSSNAYWYCRIITINDDNTFSFSANQYISSSPIPYFNYNGILYNNYAYVPCKNSGNDMYIAKYSIDNDTVTLEEYTKIATDARTGGAYPAKIRALNGVLFLFYENTNNTITFIKLNNTSPISVNKTATAQYSNNSYYGVNIVGGNFLILYINAPKLSEYYFRAELVDQNLQLLDATSMGVTSSGYLRLIKYSNTIYFNAISVQSIKAKSVNLYGLQVVGVKQNKIYTTQILVSDNLSAIIESSLDDILVDTELNNKTFLGKTNGTCRLNIINLTGQKRTAILNGITAQRITPSQAGKVII